MSLLSSPTTATTTTTTATTCRWAHLTVQATQQDGQQLPSFAESSVCKPKHRVGRDPRCETSLEGFNVVSSEHCHITTKFEPVQNPHQQQWVVRAYLTDNSTNGTLVASSSGAGGGKQRVLKRGEQVELQEGDEISMRGKATAFKLVFHLDAFASLPQLEQFAKDMASSPATSSLASPVPSSSSKQQPPTSATTTTSQEELSRLRSRVLQVEDALQRECALHEDTKRAMTKELDSMTKALSALHEEFGKKERSKRTVDAQLADERDKTAGLLEKQFAAETRSEESASAAGKLQLALTELSAAKAEQEAQSRDQARLAAQAREELEQQCGDWEAANLQLGLAAQGHVAEISKLTAQVDALVQERNASRQHFDTQLACAQQEVAAAAQLARDKDAALLGVQTELKQHRQDAQQQAEHGAGVRTGLEESLVKQERGVASLLQSQHTLQLRVDKLTQQKLDATAEAARQAELVSAAARKLDEAEQRLAVEQTKCAGLQSKVQELNVLRAQAEAMSAQVREYKDKAVALEDELRGERRTFLLREEELAQLVQEERAQVERVRRDMLVQRGEFETTIAAKLDALRFVEHLVSSSLLPALRDALPPQQLQQLQRSHTQVGEEEEEEEAQEVERQATPQLVFDSPSKPPQVSATQLTALNAAETQLDVGEEPAPSNNSHKRARMLNRLSEVPDDEEQEEESSSSQRSKTSSLPRRHRLGAAAGGTLGTTQVTRATQDSV